MGELIIAGLSTLVPASLGTLSVPLWLTGTANLLGSALLSAGAARLSRRRPGEVKEDIRLPRSLPAVRWVWGPGTRAPGTAIYLGEKGGKRYLAYLVNSRASDIGGLALRLDGRDITLSGDPQNFGPLTRGTVTIAEGETQAVITHGLGETPDRAGAYADGLVAEIDLIGATTFRATLAEPAPEGGQVLSWVCYADAPGARALLPTNLVNFLEVWVQDGTETHPPTRMLIENGDPNSGQGGPLFGADATANPLWHTDKHHGLTVIWIAMRLGDTKSRQSRWPGPIPVLDCAMNWSRIYNPLFDTARGGDGPQRMNDPATWQPTGNQSACMLDLARFNPVWPWPDDQIWLETFKFGAEIADEDVPLKDGGTVKRYSVAGVQTFADREMPALLSEMADAGGGKLFTAGGRLGYRPGCWIAPDATITGPLRGSVKYKRDRDRTSTPQAVRVIYVDPGADWEDATFDPVRVVPEWAGDERRVFTWTQPLVANPYQAMRLQQMRARRLALGRRIEGEFAPAPAADLVCGGGVTYADTAAPYRNAVYEVTDKDGLFSIADPDSGAAFRVKLGMDEITEHVYAWVPETDELPYQAAVGDSLNLDLPMPFNMSGVFDIDFFGADRLQVTFSAPGAFVPDFAGGGPDIFVPDSRITGFEWEWQGNQDDFVPAGQVTATGETGTLNLSGVVTGSYIVRVRSVGDGSVSAWAYAGPFLFNVDLTVPTAVTATGGVTQITVDATSPAGDHVALQYWGNDIDDPWSATSLAEQVVATLTADAYTETGLDADTTRFYFVRSVAASAAVGPWASASATTDP